MYATFTQPGGMSLSLSEIFLILPKDHFLIGGTKAEEWWKNTKHESAHRKKTCPTALYINKIWTSR